MAPMARLCRAVQLAALSRSSTALNIISSDSSRAQTRVAAADFRRTRVRGASWWRWAVYALCAAVAVMLTFAPLLVVEKPPVPVHHLECVNNPSILLLLMHLPPVLLASLTPACLASLMPGLHSCNVTHERESCAFVLFPCRC